MSSFKPIDGSKEDFRKYLDRKGVLDAITKVLIKCNSDRPENAIEYLLDNLGEKLKDKDTIARLENDLNDARNEIEALKQEIDNLKVSAKTADAMSNNKEESGDPPAVSSSANENEQRATPVATKGTPEQVSLPPTSESGGGVETVAEISEPVAEPKETGAQ
ncbi:c-Myc-binding protein [Uranotaenia lowii]|uniref:c-Myc-binding protein n=1 Tax=Uranotaenia lowii TaxID=190385 RepID=UPI002478F80E|nr:c-Myc-binding protein [Uranotaenia lowii]